MAIQYHMVSPENLGVKGGEGKGRDLIILQSQRRKGKKFKIWAHKKNGEKEKM